MPDECERDCNSNGVPDDCDVDPLDPDGDEWVSADCNANGIPDECELDCNENGVPDDCDIDPEDPDGDEWVSADCNANGLPDECDILLEGCEDANEDDCCDEEESLMGGGGSMMSGPSEGPCAELSEDECWTVFYDWAMQQCWGPQCESTGLQQYQAAKEKLAELWLE